MINHAVIYHQEKPPALDPDADYLRIHAGLEPGHLRLTPAALKKLCSKYRQITLVLPIATNDDLQQGKHENQQTFLLELFRHWTNKSHVTLHVVQADKSDESTSKSEHHVTSVQAWHEKSQINAERIAKSYFRFLPVWSRRLIQSRQKETSIVALSLFGIELLELEQENKKDLPPEISAWIIKGGKMAGGKGYARGRLWFIRSGVHPGLVYAALTHYRPSLPWWIYLISQAVIHQAVMKRFGSWRSRIMRRHHWHPY
jgi:hypothetical protein